MQETGGLPIKEMIIMNTAVNRNLGLLPVGADIFAVVEAIDEDIVTISESHWRGKYFNTKTFSNPNSAYRQTFYGYIYASDSVFAERACLQLYARKYLNLLKLL